MTERADTIDLKLLMKVYDRLVKLCRVCTCGHPVQVKNGAVIFDSRHHTDDCVHSIAIECLRILESL
jgi:hypothetical protein